MAISLILAVLTVLSLSLITQCTPVFRQISTIRDQSQIHDALLNLGATWPVPSVPASDISSTFGPRVYKTVHRYDFHRGIDISAEKGTPVVAILDGAFYGRRFYNGGGRTAIIDHPVSILFHGQNQTSMSSFYMHLDSYHPDILTASKGDSITAGQIIGYVGDSGSSVVAPHLHFEIRLGSRCSLEYQLAHPSYSCASLGQDPHLHPLGLFPGPTAASDEIHISLLDTLNSTQDGIVEISAPDDYPVVNRYELLKVQAWCCKKELIAVLDYNLREGFVATSTQALDDPQTNNGLPRIVPFSFGRSADTWMVQYVIPAGFSTKAAGERLQLLVTNVYYATFTIHIDDPNDSW